MSTPNFTRINAKHYYAVEEVDELKVQDLIRGAEQLGFEENIEQFGDKMKFASKDISECFGNSNDVDNSFYFELELYLVYGYYSGATIDYDIRIVSNGYEDRLSEYDPNYVSIAQDKADNWLAYWETYAAYSASGKPWLAGLCNMQKKNVQKWIEKIVAKLTEEGEAACAALCDQKLGGAVLSNGEGVYWEVA